MAAIVLEGEPDAASPHVSEGAAEAIAEGAVDVAEAQADAACEIAETQADRDVALAEIEQKTRLGEAEIIAEAATDAELEQCRNRISELEGLNSVLATELESLRSPASSIPSTSEESPTPLPEPESVAPTLDSPERAEEPEPAERPRAKKKFRWI